MASAAAPEALPPGTEIQAPGNFSAKRKKWGLTFSAPENHQLTYIEQWYNGTGEFAEDAHEDAISADDLRDRIAPLYIRDFSMLGTLVVHTLGFEEHKEEDVRGFPRIHLHANLSYKESIRVSNPRHFDTAGDHPNIVKGAPGEGWENYCRKDGVFVSNKESSGWGAIATQADTDVGAAMGMVKEQFPREWVLYGNRIHDNLTTAATRESKRRRVESARSNARTLDDFDLWKDFVVSDEDLVRYAIVFIGEAGIGKSAFAKAHLKRPCVVRTLDALRRFQPDEHDGLVIDDPHFISSMSREQKIALLDVENETQIKARYTDAEFPEKTPRIFTINTGYDHLDCDVDSAADPALKRRVKYVHLPGRGWSDPVPMEEEN